MLTGTFAEPVCRHSETSAGLKYLYVRAFSGLHLRSRPDPASPILETLPYGTRVILVSRTAISFAFEGKSGRWLAIAHHRFQGYAFSELLQETELPTILNRYAAQFDIGSYYPSTELILYSDSSAELHINFCHTIDAASGKWERRESNLRIQFSDSKLDPWLPNRSLEFEVQPSGDLFYGGKELYACSLGGDKADSRRRLHREK